jgi:hypothetical protein
MNSTEERDWEEKSEQSDQNQPANQKVTHNLDTGEIEPLEDLEDKPIMDFGSGSGGGSAGDGGGS